MGFDDALLQYGAFGLWTIFNIALIRYFLKKADERETKMSELASEVTKTVATNSAQIEQNTAVLKEALEVLKNKN